MDQDRIWSHAKKRRTKNTKPSVAGWVVANYQNFQAVRKNDGRFDDVTPDDVYDFRAEDGSFEEFEDSLFDEEEVEGVALKKSG